jgi:hypothetical protein
MTIVLICLINIQQILTGGGFEWVCSSSGEVHPHAVPTGTTTTEETLYIGRAQHEASMTVGKVHPSHGCLFIPYAGKEHTFRDYEILIKKPA